MVKNFAIALISILLVLGCASVQKPQTDDFASKWITVEYVSESGESLSPRFSLPGLKHGGNYSLSKPDGSFYKISLILIDDPNNPPTKKDKKKYDYMTKLLNIEVVGDEPIMSLTTAFSGFVDNPDGIEAYIGDPDGTGYTLRIKLVDGENQTFTRHGTTVRVEMDSDGNQISSETKRSITLSRDDVTLISDFGDIADLNIRQIVITADESMIESIQSSKSTIRLHAPSESSNPAFDEIKVTISATEMSLDELLSDLADQSNLNIIRTGKADDDLYKQKITLQFSDIHIKEAIEALTKSTGLEYRSLGNTGFLIGPADLVNP